MKPVFNVDQTVYAEAIKSWLKEQLAQAVAREVEYYNAYLEASRLVYELECKLKEEDGK